MIQELARSNPPLHHPLPSSTQLPTTPPAIEFNPAPHHIIRYRARPSSPPHHSLPSYGGVSARLGSEWCSGELSFDWPLLQLRCELPTTPPTTELYRHTSVALQRVVWWGAGSSSVAGGVVGNWVELGSGWCSGGLSRASSYIIVCSC